MENKPSRCSDFLGCQEVTSCLSKLVTLKLLLWAEFRYLQATAVLGRVRDSWLMKQDLGYRNRRLQRCLVLLLLYLLFPLVCERGSLHALFSNFAHERGSARAPGFAPSSRRLPGGLQDALLIAFRIAALQKGSPPQFQLALGPEATPHHHHFPDPLRWPGRTDARGKAMLSDGMFYVTYGK